MNTHTWALDTCFSSTAMTNARGRFETISTGDNERPKIVLIYVVECSVTSGRSFVLGVKTRSFIDDDDLNGKWCDGGNIYLWVKNRWHRWLSQPVDSLKTIISDSHSLNFLFGHSKRLANGHCCCCCDTTMTMWRCGDAIHIRWPLTDRQSSLRLFTCAAESFLFHVLRRRSIIHVKDDLQSAMADGQRME